ncbi:hypothetical protein LSH36_192g03023 [Paralvinella palmiformis]|uniref:Protein saal1 n=1 Tax=Paralvinella palmiformis TaxID=53620 RepID=A0AAD9JQA3_9ANNE|nr:hypothetical protein LSH36_192g03023 [Paralvinella palmiformis]
MDGTEEENNTENRTGSNQGEKSEHESLEADCEVVANNHDQPSGDHIVHKSGRSQDANVEKSPAAENSCDVIVLDSDEERYTNPEPPKELMSNEVFHADMIGDTMFSKHWLFTTLMNLIKAVDQEENAKAEGQMSERGMDLDDALQDELCKLWDMSMNPAVVNLLMEFKAIDLLAGVISKSKAPRATEICVGILGNMACTEVGCKAVSDNKGLRTLMFLLLESPDGMTLVEVTRLIYTCLSSDSVYHLWITSLRENPSVYNSLVFILCSSTNSDLLLHASELIDKIMDTEDNLLIQWSTSDMVQGVLEAIKQCSSSKDALDAYLHILQLISTCDPGVEAIGVHSTSICDLTLQYLIQLCAEDILVIEGQENSVGCVLCVLTTAFTALEDKSKLVVSDFQLMRCLLKILSCVYSKVRELTPDIRKRARSDSISERSCLRSDSVNESDHSHRLSQYDGKPNPQPAEDKQQEEKDNLLHPDSGSAIEVGETSQTGNKDDVERQEAVCDAATIEMLYEVIQNILTDVVLVLCEEDEISPSTEPEKPDNSKEANATEKTPSSSDQSANTEKPHDYVPKTLTYLNELCVRQRLRILVYTLDEVLQDTEVDCCGRLRQMAQKYGLSRLDKIVEEYNAG